MAVIGASDATTREIEQAEEVGERLALARAVVVCGGLGGVMHAAARGCASAGGTSIGILPGDDRDPGSPHLTVVVSTGLGETRNALVVRTVDAVIAVSGGFGTLSEIGLALRMGKPVIGLDTWELSRRGTRVEAVIPAASPAQAVELALKNAEPAV